MCRWYELYEERTASTSATSHQHLPIPNVPASSAAAVSVGFPGHHELSMPIPPVAQPPVADGITLMQMAPPNSGTVAAMSGGMGSYQPGAMPFVPPQQMQLMPHVYGPYTYVHPMAAGNQPGGAQARPNFPFYTIPVQQHSPSVPLARCSYQGQYMNSAGGPSASVPVPPPAPQSVAMAPAYLNSSPAVYHAGMSSVRPPVQFAYLAPMPSLPVPPMSSSYVGAQPVDVEASMNIAIQQQQQVNAMDEVAGAAVKASIDDIHINYMLAAFRVGMLAMDTLSKRVHDDRPHIKYGRNPPHGEEVKWLLGISCKLGTLLHLLISKKPEIVFKFYANTLLIKTINCSSTAQNNNKTQVQVIATLPYRNSCRSQ